MKKIYILTCINEKKQLVAIKSYKSEKEARDDMKGQWEAENRDAENSGYEDIEGCCNGRYASISYGDECEYHWEVSEVYDPVAEDAAMDSMKQDFIERAYFDAKATIEGDDVYRLSEPVGDYDSFCLNEGDETIEVWDCVKRNYTSIFSLPTDVAYEIAKRIYGGDYKVEDNNE